MREPSPLLLGGQGVTGTPAAAKVSSQSDLVIGVGCRMMDFATGSQSAFNNPEVKFVNINVGGHDAYKQNGVPIIADAREAILALTQATEGAGIQPNSVYIGEIEGLNREWTEQLGAAVSEEVPDEAMSQGKLIRVINEEAQPGDTIVAAAGNAAGRFG